MSHLVPCPSCSRHVRASETECPFCGEVVDLVGGPLPAVPTSRLGRAATFAFGATLIGATSMVACGGDSDDGDDGSGGTVSSGGSSGKSGTGGTAGAPDASGAVGPVYGAPASGGTSGSGGGSTAGNAGSPQPLYGAAPAD